MGRPKSKSELVEKSQNNYKTLKELVKIYSEEEILKEFPKGTLNRNIKDILSHLLEWHLMFLQWYKIGNRGGQPYMPAKGYTWRCLPELNRKIWEKHKHIKLKDVIFLLDDSYEQIQRIIAKHSDEELFEKKRYKWTGSTSLGEYIISNTSSHYSWAIRLIIKLMK